MVYFRSLLKEEFVDFQSLMISLNGKMVNSNQDKKVWSLEPSGYFTVKSLVTSPIDVSLFRGLWKTKSPRRVNISV